MSNTPETDEYEDGCINPSEWSAFARKLERQRDVYKNAFEVAMYNLIGVAGHGHPGVKESEAIVSLLNTTTPTP